MVFRRNPLALLVIVVGLWNSVLGAALAQAQTAGGQPASAPPLPSPSQSNSSPGPSAPTQPAASSPRQSAPMQPASTTSSPRTAPARRPPPGPWSPGASWLAVELGLGHSDDANNVFQDGWGRSLTMSFEQWEVRLFEAYDMRDPTETYAGERAEGQMTFTSVGKRIPVLRLGPATVGALVGASWARRPSIRFDENALVNSDGYSDRAQHGLGAVLGIGASARLVSGLFVAVDVRVHPVVWMDIEGQRVVLQDDIATTTTINDSPDGFPTTTTVFLGIAR